jgi:CcmD family protein
MRLRRFVTVLAAILMLAASAMAQQPPAQLDGFTPMSKLAPREELPATPLVFYAYAFVWLAVLAYVFSIWRRMSRVEQELAEVQRRLKSGTGGTAR